MDRPPGSICSAHFHVGVDDADKATSIVNTLMFYHPFLLALTASSPYYERDDTGLASCRTSILEAMPTAGFPDLLSGWLSSCACTTRCWPAGPSPGPGDLVGRTSPPGVRHGGAEDVRRPSTLGEVAAVAALAQCLVRRIDDAINQATRHNAAPPDPSSEQMGAVRDGLDAAIVIDEHR